MFCLIYVRISLTVNLPFASFYHFFVLAASVDLKYPDGLVHVTMIPNPSHLEVHMKIYLLKIDTEPHFINLLRRIIQ